jgi:hypothetical protein
MIYPPLTFKDTRITYQNQIRIGQTVEGDKDGLRFTVIGFQLKDKQDGLREKKFAVSSLQFPVRKTVEGDKDGSHFSANR